MKRKLALFMVLAMLMSLSAHPLTSKEVCELAEGGNVKAQAIFGQMGRALGRPAMFVERPDGVFHLRRGFALDPGTRISGPVFGSRFVKWLRAFSAVTKARTTRPAPPPCLWLWRAGLSRMRILAGLFIAYRASRVRIGLPSTTGGAMPATVEPGRATWIRHAFWRWR